MNTFKRILALLLALVFISAALMGCKKNKTDDNQQDDGKKTEQKDTEKQTNEYGEESFSGSLPIQDLDFGGAELTILVRDNVICSREWHKESPEDELDEAVAMRNAAVEATLNLKMKYQMVPDASYDAFAEAFNGMITDDIVSDMHNYDIAANFAYAGAYPSVREFAANLNDKEMFPHFDFSLPCWNQAIVQNTTINGRLHYVAGDINLSMFDAAMVIWYNKTLYDAKKDDTDPENIQTHALAGLWTYDDLYAWTELYENSNGADEGKDAADTYGLSISHSKRGNPNPHDAIPYAWDLEFVLTNNDGTHSFNIEGNTKAEDALTKFRKLIYAEGSRKNGSVNNFAAGHYVFWTGSIYPNEDANMTIRQMEDKYGLLPWPKYEATQENYGTTSQDYYTLMTVLDHAESSVTTLGDEISAYLQFATEESYTSVRGYYFNRIIKPKYFGVDNSEGTVTNSIALFDIIVDNIEFDYWTIYSPQLNDVAWLWRDAVGTEDGGEVSLESIYMSEEDLYKQMIEETDAWLGLRAAE
jgi:hypothetical protein